jgi:hypothetical protein
MKKLIILFVMLFTGLVSFSQYTPIRIEDSGVTPSARGNADGDVFLYQDWKLLNLVKKHVQANDNTFPGWRVQIFFGSGRTAPDQANDTKTKFLQKYAPKYDAYIVYEQPYFRVLVGDFRTRAEALRFKELLTKAFPNSWVVPTIVNYPEKSE